MTIAAITQGPHAVTLPSGPPAGFSLQGTGTQPAIAQPAETIRSAPLVAQASSDQAVTRAHGTGQVVGADGRVAGANVDLGGRTAGAYVATLSEAQLKALSPADRAELTRVAAGEIEAQRTNLKTGNPVDSRAEAAATEALSRLYGTWRPSAERMADLKAKTAAFTQEFSQTYDIRQMNARWDSLSPKEQETVLRDIHAMHARHFGYEPATLTLVTKPRNKEEALWATRAGGDYNPVTNEMRLNGNPERPGPKDFLNQVATVVHEGYHRRQDLEAEAAVANGLPQPPTGKAGDAVMYWANYQNHAFVGNAGQMGYQGNPLEQEAWLATDAFLGGLKRPGLLPAGHPLRTDLRQLTD
ncbi:hypothetical protein [Salinarimonas soli]|uniref:Uncharacterized protein n=1 Tax=Salinarimonas soli TaxID=1638099 RepID=A0A5B2VUY0_9HYPH|nr:hypothetical protein [Salinarimonas soli]KAA2242122.1 hypothetical protein F0L46_03930 [Salinarimonas soli]